MFSENPFNSVSLVKFIPKQFDIGSEFLSKGLDKLLNAPSEIEKSYGLAKRDPSKAFRAFAAGAPELGYGIVNTPSSLLEYMQKVGLAPKELTDITNKYLRTPDMSNAISKSVGLTGEE
jgi:hypothetical protein